MRAITLVFLRILNELVLLEEVFHCSLLAAHLILENLDLRLQLDVIFLVVVDDLLQFDCFLVELL